MTGLLAFGRITARLSGPDQIIDAEAVRLPKRFALVQFVLLCAGLTLLTIAIVRVLVQPEGSESV